MGIFSRSVNRAAGKIAFPLVYKDHAREEGPYAVWIRNHRWNERMDRWCRKQVEQFSYKPTIGILMECHNPREEFLQESLATIFNQVYPFHELSIVDRGSSQTIREKLSDLERDSRVKISLQKGTARDVEAIAKIMKKADSEWILLMGAEDILEPHTLYNMVATLQNTVEIDFVFADSDLIDDQGRRFDPQFKPIWAVGASYPLGYYQHPVMLHGRLVRKLHGTERVSMLMEEGILLDEASNHSRYVLKAPGILYHGRKHGLKNETPPEAANNVLMNEELVVVKDKITIDSVRRQRSEPNVPLRILWMIDSLDQEDGELVWFHYLRYLASESKHRFHVVSLKDGLVRSMYEKIAPVTIASTSEVGKTISQLHSSEKFDVAFVSSVEQIWFPETLKQMDLPFVWQLYPGSTKSTDQMQDSFRYPSTILFLNQSIADQYKQIDSRGVSRILPTGVDLAHIKLFRQRNSPFDLRDNFQVSRTSTVVTVVGPTIPRKDQKLFVQTALKMLERFPEKELDFFIVGTRENSYLNEIQQIIQTSGKVDRFHLVPEKNDPFQYYPYLWISDICVSCSEQETFPLSILEAMAFKKAVIASNVFSSNEVLEHEENGYLYNTAAELHENLEFLIDKVEVRDAFARRSLEIVYEKFQFKKIVTRLEDLLRESIVFVV